MRLGIRGKFFLASLTLIVGVGFATALYLERELQKWQDETTTDRLREHALAARAVLERLPWPPQLETVDSAIKALGQSLVSRITVIANDGRVLGDSEVAREQVPALEDHSDRPEFKEAMVTGWGVVERRSASVGADMRYVALRFEHAGVRGVARASIRVSTIRASAERFGDLIALVGVVGLFAAFIVSAFASHLMSRTLRRLADSAREIVRGTSRVRVPTVGGDDIGTIARSMNKMSEELEGLVGEVAADRSYFEAVLDGVDEAVIALDEQTRVSLFNRSAREMFGLNEQCLGLNIEDVIGHRGLLDLVKAQDGQKESVAELELLGTPKRTLLARASDYPKVGGILLGIHDITEIRRVEKVRRDFVGNVSHELRTPVSVIQASAENLSDSALDNGGPLTGFVEAILRNSQRLAALISDLLELARIESGHHRLTLESVHVAAAAQGALSAFEKQAAAKRISLSLAIDEQLTVLADAIGFEQIVQNFVENAVKYSPDESTIQIRATSKAARVRLEVIDNGIGIELKHRSRLFERFYRVDPGRSRAVGGTGLGLAITKHLAQAMAGDVGMEPVESGGSCFWVSLPAGPRRS